ncbi:MAG: PDZ domain-containing protein [Thermodesulfobacteriota bacterium]|nr:PDZ domain-containing protein [Thermodesulfobacteriota bacterium]
MSKLLYSVIISFIILLIIAFAILSYIDRTVLNSSRTSSEPSTPETSEQLSKESYHLLSSKQKNTPDPVSPPVEVPLPGNKPGPPPSLNLRLVGTTVFGEKSSVILEDPEKDTRGVYRLRDTVKGFTITEILNESVTLTRNDQTVTLTLAQGGYDPSQEPFVKKVGEDSWLLSADKVTDMVSNIDQYVGQVIAYQHREGGKPAGFRIRHLKEGNDFEKMGIQNKDIIKKVNGIEVNSLTDVVKAVYQLSDDTTFTVEVERGNQPKELNYQLDKQVNALVPIITNMINIPGLGGS